MSSNAINHNVLTKSGNFAGQWSGGWMVIIVVIIIIIISRKEKEEKKRKKNEGREDIIEQV